MTDNPAILFTGEMAAAFPDAKIICTTRDPEKWWASMEDLQKNGYDMVAGYNIPIIADFEVFQGFEERDGKEASAGVLQPLKVLM